jgi:YidC/Oxa1 family membrane protein insertase
MFLPTYVVLRSIPTRKNFKVEFPEIEKGKTDYPKQASDGWIGILQHYFVAVWLPKEKANREYFTRKLDGDSYSVGVILPEQVVNPGQKVLMGTTLYAGPARS